MSRYNFKMSDYHAVRNADVAIDGITVLSGENGSGKSTVLRWLHYVVRVLCGYEEMVEAEAKRKLKNIATSLMRAVSIFRNNPTYDAEIQRLISLVPAENEGTLPIGDMVERLHGALVIFADILRRNMSHSQEKTYGLSRLYYYFDIKSPDESRREDLPEIILSEIGSRLDNIIHQSEEQLLHHETRNFAKFLSEQLDPMVEILRGNLIIDFFEDKVNLLGDDVFEQPLNLRRSIYFGTARIGYALEPVPYGKNEIRYMLRNKAKDPVPDGVSVISKVIKGIIGGEVVSDKTGDEYGMLSNELRFRNNEGLDIHLKAAATGIISFAYILRLLENGWITRDSILIIDEPEAHLHPQWIVEYARIMVLIHKNIGAKIVVASHNPDMVAAIEAVAATEGLLDNTHFYIAERRNDETDIAPRYEFRDCGSEIAPIFDSFNIAIDRINFYGRREA